MSEAHIRYMPEADILTLTIPGQKGRVKGSTAILPFGVEDGLSPTTFVLFVGYDEDEDQLTGEIVGVEVVGFHAHFQALMHALRKRLAATMPPRAFIEKEFRLDIAEINPQAFDKDIAQDVISKALLYQIPEILEDFHGDADTYFKAAAGRKSKPNTTLQKNRRLMATR